MTLDQLRIFVAVAERQHVTQASRALNLTQSAVSSAVAALESRYGVPLFDRVGRNIVLNAAGQMFLGEARAVLARADAAEAALASLGDLSRGRLSIQASQTIATYWLPPRLAAFRRAWPGVALDVLIANARQVAEAVTEGLTELGFAEGEVEAPMLEREIVDHDHMALLVAPDHPWALAEDVGSLSETPWVLREPGSGTRAVFEALLEERGMRLSDVEIALVLPANEAVLAAVEAGAGATILARRLAAASMAAGRVKEAPLNLPPRPYHLLRHRERHRSRAGEAFVALAKSFE